jgi:deoxyuridine 5'-triphosphate nucleotidohydrolase
VETIDLTGQPNFDFEPHGSLYVKRDPDQLFTPKFAKSGDVGLDLPVKINIDQAKFAKMGEERDRLRNPMLYPDVKEFIYPDGTKDDPYPFLFVPPMGWAEIPTGISIKLPDDAWGMIKSRSSTAWKKHLEVIIGTIDPGYVGLLGTLVYNPNTSPVKVYEYDPIAGKGDCLSQLILIPVYPLIKMFLVDKLPKTARGKTGFGSSSLGI